MYLRIAPHATLLLPLALATACSGSLPLDHTTPPGQNGGRPYSWIAPEAKKSQLLYVSDQGPEAVDIYSYPSGVLKGSIAGFKTVGLECVDKAGNVFVTDPQASAVFEYSHGNIIPISKLKDPGYEPISCSINPITGDLAVGNYATTGGEQGNVAIYKDAKGKPHDYAVGKIDFVFASAYDGSGNLFIDGQTSGSAFSFAELPEGGTSFKSITLNQPFTTPAGDVAWDGKYVAIVDRTASAIYQFTVSGKKGTKVGSTPLVGAANVVQFWVQSPEVIASDGTNLNVGIWNYPSGGTAIKIITGFTQPVGVTISTVKM